jgi:hypothetical protein
MSIKYCHEWALTIIDENDPSIILRDFRGNYKRISFYETYPELGAEAKAYAINECSKNTCHFTVLDLARFVDLDLENCSLNKQHFMKQTV